MVFLIEVAQVNVSILPFAMKDTTTQLPFALVALMTCMLHLFTIIILTVYYYDIRENENHINHD